MKVRASVKRHPDCILVRRKGILYRISKNKKNPRLKQRQG